VAASPVVHEATRAGAAPLAAKKGDVNRYPNNASARLFGPAIGLDIIRDPFGVLSVLAPHPLLIRASRLSLGPLTNGLSLLAEDGEPALVCRVWRDSLLGDDLEDHEHRLEGMEVLARADVIAAATSWAVGQPVTVSIKTDSA
jgi:hypothetical protein